MKLNFRTSSDIRESAMARKIVAACEALPDGDLVDTRELATLTGYTHGTLISSTNGDKSLVPYRHKQKANSLVWWGNPRTIKAFKKDV